jgi:hypothetical protein|tara:strand:- start:25 stop:348 length:324 start_codon:yes stop_codon:yes gene_type:complete
MVKTEDLIKEVGKEVVLLLLQKNKAYGDTANNPPQIFSKLSPKEGLLARIDDKLSRIKQKGLNDLTEDTVQDLIGYLILYKVQVKKEENKIKDILIEGKNQKLKEFK